MADDPPGKKAPTLGDVIRYLREHPEARPEFRGLDFEALEKVLREGPHLREDTPLVDLVRLLKQIDPGPLFKRIAAFPEGYAPTVGEVVQALGPMDEDMDDALRRLAQKRHGRVGEEDDPLRRLAEERGGGSPPPGSGKVDMRRAHAWLRKHTRESNLTCPMGKAESPHNQLIIAEDLISLPAAVTMGMRFGMTNYPAFMLICATCGYCLLFNWGVILGQTPEPEDSNG